MDNVCHTLAGAACARAGLTSPARFAAITSMIAANLPDVDVLVFASDIPSVAVRRGWTHGFLAQAVLPALLAGLMHAISRRWPRRSVRANEPSSTIGPLLVLSYVGVLSHVFLDYLNNYGVRLLMPFSGRWFYGDALFIVDPWLWIVFGIAVILGRRGSIRQVRVCLVLASVYILCMIGSARAARAIVLDRWNGTHPVPLRALMVGPAPVNPFRKAVIVDAGDHYRTGTFEWPGRNLVLNEPPVSKNDRHPAVATARHDPRIAAILIWARFPVWDIAPSQDGVHVTVRDMRFAGISRGGFSATTTIK